MLYFLLTVEHLPAFYTKYLTIRFLLDRVQAVDEGVPLLRVSLYHRFEDVGMLQVFQLKDTVG